MDKKTRGYAAECSVLDDYTSRGYAVIEQNWTMRGGEIDLIVRDGSSDTIVFVEVKLVSGMVDDVLGYITPAKISHLKRSIRFYLSKFSCYHSFDIRIDVVFVDDNGIQEVYENVYI